MKISRVLTLANTGGATVHVSLALGRDRVDDGGADVALTGAPSSLAIAPGATVPVPLTLMPTGCRIRATVIGGWIIVSSDAGGASCACPGRSRAATTSRPA